MVKVSNNFNMIINENKYNHKTEQITLKSCVKVKEISQEVKISTNKYSILNNRNDDNDIDFYKLK